MGSQLKKLYQQLFYIMQIGVWLLSSSIMFNLIDLNFKFAYVVDLIIIALQTNYVYMKLEILKFIVNLLWICTNEMIFKSEFNEFNFANILKSIYVIIFYRLNIITAFVHLLQKDYTRRYRAERGLKSNHDCIYSADMHGRMLLLNSEIELKGILKVYTCNIKIYNY